MSKKKDKKDDASGAAETVSVAAHPRARASIRRTRARTGLAAFAIVLFLSLSSDVSGQEAAVRALVAGLVGNLAGWACALAVWRQLVVAELRVVENARSERKRQAAEARAAEAEAKAAAAAA
ncbi:MAG TPA: hypothetical protein VFM58_11510 [Solirubrobacteraceae bacterium]|nr:hypothetical protein [Solirubrobacteraceae bacterium]